MDLQRIAEKKNKTLGLQIYGKNYTLFGIYINNVIIFLLLFLLTYSMAQQHLKSFEHPLMRVSFILFDFSSTYFRLEAE